jgi:threonine dehydrogenase-like Zn-dependent dehydrogenase
MQALYYADNTVVYHPDYPQPVLQTGEALLKIRLAGICSTDLEISKSYAGFTGIMGHEFVATVTAVKDPEDNVWLGKRVVASINQGCGHCRLCLQNTPKHCSNRKVLGIRGKDGIFADYATLPVANLFAVPDSVTDTVAVFAEPLAAALRIREQIAVSPSARVAVVGSGRLGILIGQILAMAGTEVTMLGRRQETLDLPAQWGLQTALVGDFADDSFDFVVEATGNSAGFMHSLRLLRAQGTLILKSTFQGLAQLDLSKLVTAEINVIGSRCGPFAPALRLLAQGAVNVESTISGEYALQDGLAALAYAAQPGIRKVLLRP